MKNKKVASMCVALGLVAVVGVGGTLAYLSANTGDLTNTFTFTDESISIKLDEAKIGADNKAVASGDRVDAGNTQAYGDVLPNMVMDKDPTVTVNPKSEECNVFVSVVNSNNSSNLNITDLNTNAWQEIDPSNFGYTAADNTKYYVYKGAKSTSTEIEEEDQFGVIATSVDPVVLEDVFEHVQAGSNLTKETTLSPIVVKAAAVQSDSVTDEIAAQTALGLLGATPNSIG